MKKNSRILLIIILGVGYSAGLFAQQVIASSGNTFYNAEGSISFTLGELVTESFSATDRVITQGFHQTTITITSLEGPENEIFSIIAYPNPTCDKVNLQIENENFSDINYILYDITGKTLLSNKIENGQTEISFAELKTAVYFLKVELSGKEIKTFKIIKE